MEGGIPTQAKPRDRGTEHDSSRERKVGSARRQAVCNGDRGERTDHTAIRGHTFRVVLVFTCFTIMSANDLSN